MIHVMQLLVALALVLVMVWVLQVFTYSIGGVLVVAGWIGLILIVFIQSKDQ